MGPGDTLLCFSADTWLNEVTSLLSEPWGWSATSSMLEVQVSNVALQSSTQTHTALMEVVMVFVNRRGRELTMIWQNAPTSPVYQVLSPSTTMRTRASKSTNLDNGLRILRNLNDSFEAQRGGLLSPLLRPDPFLVFLHGYLLAIDRDVGVRRDERVERSVEVLLVGRFYERPKVLLEPVGKGEDNGTRWHIVDVDSNGWCVDFFRYVEGHYII